MQSHSKKKVIGGHSYDVFMLSATAGLDTFLDLARIAGPALGIIVKGVGLKDIKSIGDIELDNIDFEAAARQIFQSEEKETITTIVAKLAEKTQVDGKPLANIYDVHFQGKIGELFRWLAFAMEVNFGDFFGDFLTSMGEVQEPEKKEATQE